MVSTRPSAFSALVVLALTFSSANLRGQEIPATPSRAELTIGKIKDRSGFEDGGCELLRSPDTYRSERYIFLSDFDGNAIVNANGRDIRLRLLRSRNAPHEGSGEPKQGDRSSFWYSSPNFRVRVDYVVTGSCPPDDESCEVFYYHATITVTSGKKMTVIPSYGLCGT